MQKFTAQNPILIPYNVNFFVGDEMLSGGTWSFVPLHEGEQVSIINEGEFVVDMIKHLFDYNFEALTLDYISTSIYLIRPGLQEA